MVANARRPLAPGVRDAAKEAVERLALAVVLWPGEEMRVASVA
jgi:hypothetical protein